MIVNEVKENLTRKKGFTCTMMFVVLIFALMMSTLFMAYVHMQERQDIVETYDDLSVYTLMDTLYNEEETQFMQDPEGLLKLQDMYTYLDEQLSEPFISVVTQTISVIFDDPSEADIFLSGYEYGDARSPYEENGNTYHIVKALKVNQQALDTFPIHNLVDGRLFNESDFKNPDFKTIPVLLGAEYQGVFDIGDHIESLNLGYPFTLEVIGFIEADSFINTRIEAEMYVDRFIVLPSQTFGKPQNQEEFDFLMFHYLQIINGQIFSEENQLYIEALIEQAKEATNFHDFTVLGAVDSGLGALLDTIGEQLTALIVLTVALFIIAIVMLTALMWKKIQDNFKNITIHLISGGTMTRVFRYIVAEVFFIVMTPMIIVLFAVSLFIGLHPAIVAYGAMMTAMTGLLAIIPLIILAMQLTRLSMSTVLKRGD
ncbi:hypothetical protein MM221_10415 [Salipaludibacillus sp. LMS25]|jgi:hypothetical protein|uniref:hypothetical protein n=1 Tax=Salipaludibacillus sp. LMS25 TaxID=2924031 RepID=UPI0020D1719E|nr:hypothetical protein [Salipaludibacillus sp. LMS25]UTR16881.1 hypothetical protein MM221_10415 [Salipaludibacillus sp. LMS25]